MHHDDLTYVSPVPVPALDAAPADIYRGIYGMPQFVSVPTADLPASVDFWTRGLGFVDLFSVPGQLTHLRRWAFQDVLLVPGEPAATVSSAGLSLACVLSQVEEVRAACEALVPGSTSQPRRTPWNALELRVVTPERFAVTLTAALPLDPRSEEAGYLRGLGLEIPEV
jgi:catechol 2,3-dioxygenase-like lactoylglutathione lyase family enzyme